MRPLILAKSVELPGDDLIGLDRVLFPMEGAQGCIAYSPAIHQIWRVLF
jgi:hypothetical protein